jgi:hypothetical protein
MMDLFPTLPVQRPPRVILTGAHALLRCAECCGSGERLIPPHTEADDYEMRCPECNGGGEVLRRVGDG